MKALRLRCLVWLPLPILLGGCSFSKLMHEKEKQCTFLLKTSDIVDSETAQLRQNYDSFIKNVRLLAHIGVFTERNRDVRFAACRQLVNATGGEDVILKEWSKTITKDEDVMNPRMLEAGEAAKRANENIQRLLSSIDQKTGDLVKSVNYMVGMTKGEQLLWTKILMILKQVRWLVILIILGGIGYLVFRIIRKKL